MNDMAAPAGEYAFKDARFAQSALQTQLRYKGLSAISRYQPILSLAHRRPVGFEALVGVSDQQGAPGAPGQLFGLGAELGELVELDRACRELHLANFASQDPANCWLFLNVDPRVAAEGRQFGPFFAQALARHGYPAARVVIEFTESRMADEEMLGSAVRYYRELGCLVAIDDFGAGESNFSRIWRLKPDIVKLDRSTIVAAAADPATRRMVNGMVALLHESGALVCVEGIETDVEARIAIDASADLLQGYLFARPAPMLAHDADFLPLFERLIDEFAREIGAESERSRRALNAYGSQFDAMALALEGGLPFGQAARGFLALPAAERCFLLDERGRQIGRNLVSPANRAAFDLRFAPLYDVGGANWSARHYFRRAMMEPGRIQRTRPYLSLNGPRMCMTFSVTVRLDGRQQVLCADVDAGRMDETPWPPAAN
jgi:EAL domain-containing protein (putative c-di-GMP-specific phosphodiesterase class I)